MSPLWFHACDLQKYVHINEAVDVFVVVVWLAPSVDEDYAYYLTIVKTLAPIQKITLRKKDFEAAREYFVQMRQYPTSTRGSLRNRRGENWTKVMLSSFIEETQTALDGFLKLIGVDRSKLTADQEKSLKDALLTWCSFLTSSRYDVQFE